MTGLDTNVLVRYLTQDDPVQSAQANQLSKHFLKEKAYLSTISFYVN